MAPDERVMVSGSRQGPTLETNSRFVNREGGQDRLILAKSFSTSEILFNTPERISGLKGVSQCMGDR